MHNPFKYLAGYENTVSPGNASYTVFSDSTAALSRAQTDRTGPGRAFTRAIIEISERLGARRCLVKLRWTLAHKGVGDNEVAGEYAKAAAECAGDATDLRGTSLAHLAREATEAKTQSTTTGPRTTSRAAGATGLRGAAASVLTSGRSERRYERYCQLLSGHAATGAYLADKIEKIPSSVCPITEKTRNIRINAKIP